MMYRTPHSKLQSCSAFTLVELLVVIVIIGILAAILLPVIGTIRDKGDSAVSVNAMKQLGTSMAVVAGDNNYNLPVHSCGAGNWYARVSGSEYGTSVRMASWVPAFLNKTATKKEKYSPTTDITFPRVYAAAYGMNGYLNQPPGGSTYAFGNPYLTGTPGSGTWSSLKLPKVSGVVVLADSFIQSGGYAGAGLYYKNKTGSESISFRHPGNKAAMLFADWHIELVTRAEVDADNGKWFDPTK